ncbi:hypothetical protein [Pelagicoccus sp. SDUM812003]|uniref:hypothetical protein n=1 Tax=Pelagicoccus sp. SDUM812003 TaxID=3041267 RepID=UPI00280FC2E3|nr:hypothetical protein [Pelagicoccus sp. SDUM812003]MDQ8205671.1 hypothetical protein [Pelagicoccus sp. SDUM812003]
MKTIAPPPIRAFLIGCLIPAAVALSSESASEDTIASLSVAVEQRNMEAIASFREKLSEQDVDAFMHLVESLPHSPYRESLFFIVVEELARFDGAFAVNYALDLETAKRQEYASYALLAWVRNEPEEAWEFFLTLTNFGQDRAFKAEMLIHGAAETDIEKAFQFYNQLSDEVDCVDCSAKTILRRLFYNDDLSKIFEYEAQIEDPFKLDQWRRNKWDMWGYYQPLAALERIKQIASPTEQDDARISVYSGWARYQPRESIEHLLAFQSDDLFADAFPKIIHEWGTHSLLDQSLDLIKSIDRDSITDRSIVAITSRLASIDPKFSWELVESIEDETIRRTGMRQFVWSTSKSDPDFLRELIDGSADSAVQKELLWWFLQFVPANGHFDLPADMRYFDLINSYNNNNESLRLLVSEVLNATSPTSRHITPNRLALAIAEQKWLNSDDRERFITLLNSK